MVLSCLGRFIENAVVPFLVDSLHQTKMEGCNIIRTITFISLLALTSASPNSRKSKFTA